MRSIAPIGCLLAVAAFESLNKVVDACFGKDLLDNYEDLFDKFQNDFLCLGISVTPKVHALIYHVPQFCKLVGQGLSIYSEEAAESLHHDFDEFWNSYKVNDLNHPSYIKYLLSAVWTYNSRHI